MLHEIEFAGQSFVGSFTAELPPLLTVQSGDRIQFRCLDAGWGTNDENKSRIKPFARRDKLDGGHALIGPIRIENAKPGMTLHVKFNNIIPGSYGFTCAGEYPNWQNEKLNLTQYKEILLNWRLDSARMIGACDLSGHRYEVGLKPFMGVVGMPPEPNGIFPTWPPRFCGGNIDCKELVAGSSLYLPIPVEGGYLSIGDGHARQGDGEISCQAIECPMELVDITLHLIEDLKLSFPRAHTPSGWLTFGFHEDLNEATVQAIDGMLDLLVQLYGISRVEAIALGSSVVDLRITQVVNGVKGVHACLPHDALQRKPIR